MRTEVSPDTVCPTLYRAVFNELNKARAIHLPGYEPFQPLVKKPPPFRAPKNPAQNTQENGMDEITAFLSDKPFQPFSLVPSDDFLQRLCDFDSIALNSLHAFFTRAEQFAWHDLTEMAFARLPAADANELSTVTVEFPMETDNDYLFFRGIVYQDQQSKLLRSLGTLIAKSFRVFCLSRSQTSLSFPNRLFPPKRITPLNLTRVYTCANAPTLLSMEDGSVQIANSDYFKNYNWRFPLSSRLIPFMTEGYAESLKNQGVIFEVDPIRI